MQPSAALQAHRTPVTACMRALYFCRSLTWQFASFATNLLLNGTTFTVY